MFCYGRSRGDGVGMGANDEHLLRVSLETWRVESAPDLAEDEFFEFFSAEQALRAIANPDLSDVQSGLVDGSGDGGVDAIYVLVGSHVMTEDPPQSFLAGQDQVDLTLLLVQAKKKRGFAETPLQKLADTLSDILDLSKSLELLRVSGLYSAILLDRISVFRACWEELVQMGKLSRVIVRIDYCAIGDAQRVSKGVSARATNVAQRVRSYGSSIEVSVRFLGAAELLALHRKRRRPPLRLDALATLEEDDASGYVALVSLEAYRAFLTDETGSERQYLYEENVRDFEGDVQVNRAIQETLSDDHAPSFWWLNNGITLVASRISRAGKTFMIDDAQIVNGLQTSRLLFRAAHVSIPKPNQTLLVRLIAESDATVRDRVIRSTNSQTAIKPGALLATDEFQRQLEEFFRVHGFYYERRKNQYRDSGHPLERIVTVTDLARAVRAIQGGEPDVARSKTWSLLRTPSDQARVFNPKRELKDYLCVIQVQRAVDDFMKTDPAVDAQYRVNLKFHVSCSVMAVKRRGWPSNAGLSPVHGWTPSREELEGAYAMTVDALQTYMSSNAEESLERIVKGPRFREHLKELHRGSRRRGR